MSVMLEIHHFRLVLLFTTLPAMVISYILGDSGYEVQKPVFFAMAAFLTASLVQNFSVLCYVLLRIRAGRTKGYFRIPTTADGSHVSNVESIAYSRMGTGVLAATIISDLVLGIALIVVVPIGFTANDSAAAGVACMGAIVAIVAHFFFVLMACDFGAVSKYKLKIEIVRRGEENSLRAISGPKEESSSESSLHHEPGHISPRPYRGSPSTKATKAPDSPRTGPIRLIEPTEGDSLIADHD